MANVPRAPIISPQFSPLRDVGLRTWTHENPLLYTNPLVPAPTEFPVTSVQRFNTSQQTWLSENPNLYTNPKAPLGYDYPTPPQAWRFDTDLRTCLNQNPNLYVPSTPPPPTQAPLNQYDWPLPIQRVPLMRDRVEQDFIRTFQPKPFNQTDWPTTPPPIYFTNEIRTTININSSLYLNPKPFFQTDWPTPPPRTYYTNELRTWLQTNPAIYTNPKPFFQTDWPTPPAREYSHQMRSWTYGNPSIDPPPVVTGARTERFISISHKIGITLS